MERPDELPEEVEEFNREKWEEEYKKLKQKDLDERTNRARQRMNHIFDKEKVRLAVLAQAPEGGALVPIQYLIPNGWSVVVTLSGRDE